jgi:sodium-dependent dicarboxylate transporter 2/3/5
MYKVFIGLFPALWFRFSGYDFGYPVYELYTIAVVLFALVAWTTEMIEAYVVGLLVVAMALLAPKAEGVNVNQILNQWGSEVIWIFLGGFVLGKASTRVELDRSMLHWLLPITRYNKRSFFILIVLFAFILSGFISNTATAALLLALLAPLAHENKYPVYLGLLYLGMAFGASLGGLLTPIGSPANVLALKQLERIHVSISFLDWMMYGTLVGIPLLFVVSSILLIRHQKAFEGDFELEWKERPPESKAKKMIVVSVLMLTALAWMFSAYLHVSMSLIAIVSISVLGSTNMIQKEDIRSLPWDTLLLIFGGLVLGHMVEDSGLGIRIAKLVGQWTNPTIAWLAMLLGISLISNFMSNTAATGLLVPIALSMQSGSPAMIAMGIAMSASTGMLLPVSTPPSMLAYGTGKLNSKDFIVPGLILFLLGPLLIWLLFPFFFE